MVDPNHDPLDIYSLNPARPSNFRAPSPAPLIVMQPRTPQHSPRKRARQDNRNRSPQQLLFPILPFDGSIQLQNSRLIENPRAIMASHTDESSVDGMSSVGDAWEEIDERSVSDNGTSSLSRQLTPMSERMDAFEYGVSSFMSNATSSDHQGTSNGHEDGNNVKSQNQDMFTPTAATLHSATWGAPERSTRPTYIKVKEEGIESTQDQTGKSLKYITERLTHFSDETLKSFRSLFPGEDGPQDAYLQMTLGQESLSLGSPFELFYVGSREMRSTLVEKVGAVLTARTGAPMPVVDIDSSRVTVVPVSEFHSDASPEVVLIDSVGVDMKITHCNKAWVESNGNIGLNINNNAQKITSYTHWDGKSHVFPSGVKIPDMAIIFVPEVEADAAKYTRKAASYFLSRCKIPFLVICENGAAYHHDASVDGTLPYLRLPSSADRTLSRACPIDLNTFLALDASQLNRNLAHSISKRREESESRFRVKEIVRYVASEAGRRVEEGVSKFKTDVCDFYTGFPGSLKTLWFSWIAQVRGRPTYYSAILMTLLVLQVLAWILEPEIMTNPNATSKIFDPLRVKMNNMWTLERPTVTLHMPEPTAPPKRLDELSIRDIGGLSEVLQTASAKASASDKVVYTANIIGDSHVIVIREAPNGAHSKPAKLNFAVHRSGKPIVHDVSKVSEGVHVIELPIEDAYGKIDISVWTTGRLKVNETFSVDFGTPWLKISAWLNSAQAMNKHAREELISYGSSLSQILISTKFEVSGRLNEAMNKASKIAGDFEKSFEKRKDRVRILFTGAQELLQNAKAGLLKREITLEKHIAQMKRSLRLGFESLRFDKRSCENMGRKSWKHQRSGDAPKSFPGLQRLGCDFQQFRSKHFREYEKKLLQTWWKVRAAIPTAKTETKARKR